MTVHVSVRWCGLGGHTGQGRWLVTGAGTTGLVGSMRSVHAAGTFHSSFGHFLETVGNSLEFVHQVGHGWGNWFCVSCCTGMGDRVERGW